ncbi:unnamed protein product [Rotaria sp. Silwood1]|nr:unnamed protein product [Rotaria sp. Silwood1]
MYFLSLSTTVNIFLLILLLSSVFCTDSEISPEAAIAINRSSNTHAFVTLYNVFMKYQDPTQSILFVPSDNFVYVPNMDKAFSVTQNTLFRITFQGFLWSNYQVVQSYIQILVNDYLIIGDRLLPNTKQRFTMSLGTGQDETDLIGDGFYNGGQGDTGILANRVALVYLPRGTYTFNVGVSSSNQPGNLKRGFVTYELTQFDNSSENQDLGGLKLATFPSK